MYVYVCMYVCSVCVHTHSNVSIFTHTHTHTHTHRCNTTICLGKVSSSLPQATRDKVPKPFILIP